ncbi:MAG TPA: serine hydrolase domain-containing protein, partial [Thermomicrobiaceae bacterium]|nr:serine hydrolase domain-containing protein [Thermomicrobiaceae bacterium]
MSEATGQKTGLDQAVVQAMDQFKVPGMAVGILHEGVIGAHGYGIANIETDQPVSPDTIFQIGSISKIFTTTTIMTFVDEGKLDLDTPVVEYLPDLEFADPEAGNVITLRHLLSHTSGVFGDHFTDYGAGDDALQKGMADVKTLRQITKPGELWTYCNLGFDIAGAIIEKISGQRFEDVVHERVLKPIGMEHTFYTAQEVITYPHAVGHNPVKPGADEVEVAHNWWLSRWVAPPGGISSIVADMLLFAQCHMNEGKAGDTQVLSAKSTAAMQEPRTVAGNFAESYGLGWAIDTIDGVKAVSHGGSTNGFNAHLDLIPSQHFAICTLTNSSRGSAAYRKVIRWALQEYCGLTSRDPETISLPEDQLKV